MSLAWRVVMYSFLRSRNRRAPILLRSCFLALGVSLGEKGGKVSDEDRSGRGARRHSLLVRFMTNAPCVLLAT